jgi:peptidoglycan/LPS O-acetylase OafA/YrhL
MNRHIKALDGLRALAVTLVMLYHFGTYKFGGLTVELGWVGVQLFFVLSGFLITQILLSDREQALGDYLKRFYWRRSLRIFPLYFLYLFLVTGIYVATSQPVKFTEQAPMLFSYTYNFGLLAGVWYHSAFLTHLWSLSVEEQFYLFWPFVIYFVPFAWLKRLVVGLIIAGPLFRWGLASWIGGLLPPEEADDALYWFTLSHLDAFATGAAMVVWGQGASVSQVKRWMWAAIALCGGAGALNLWASHDLDWTTLGYPIAKLEHYQHLWSYTLLNLASALIILWATHLGPNHWLAGRLPTAVGKVSYGMYVYHWGILAMMSRLYLKIGGENFGWLGAIAFFGAYYAVLYTVSYLSFQFFEVKFIQLKDRYFKKVTVPRS